jgi:transcription-repair coupling factor (superfamily II helicase)
MRRFDPASQRTIEKLESLLVTPAREYIAVGEQETELSEFHIPMLHQQPASLLDYLTQKAVVLIDDLSIVEGMAEEVEEQAVKFRQESIAEEILSRDFPLPYIPWSELHDSLHEHASLELGHSTEELTDISLAAEFGHDERFGGRLKQFVEYLASIVGRGEQVIVVSRQSPRLQELWLEADHHESDIEIHNSLRPR